MRPPSQRQSSSVHTLWTVQACAGALLALVAVPGCAEESRCQDAPVATAHLGLFGGAADAGHPTRQDTLSRAIGVFYNGGATHTCTGTFIRNGYVLTAHHCRPQANDIFRTDAGCQGQVAFVVHHDALDVAVVRVQTADCEPATLPIASGPPKLRRTYILTGVESGSDTPSGKLTYVAEPVTEVEPESITVDGFGQSGACIGDSGGPLLDLSAERAEVVGVLEEGSATCHDWDRYVRLDGLHDWLDAVTTSVPCSAED